MGIDALVTSRVRNIKRQNGMLAFQAVFFCFEIRWLVAVSWRIGFPFSMPAVIYICIMMQSAVKVTEYIAISTKWFYNAHMI